jgi:hypothetical protein
MCSIQKAFWKREQNNKKEYEKLQKERIKFFLHHKKASTKQKIEPDDEEGISSKRRLNFE